MRKAAKERNAGVADVAAAFGAVGKADREKLFVGVELDRWQPEDQEAVTLGLGLALGRVPLPWDLGVVMLDLAQDPVGDWMLTSVAPFFERHPSEH